MVNNYLFCPLPINKLLIFLKRSHVALQDLKYPTIWLYNDHLWFQPVKNIMVIHNPWELWREGVLLLWWGGDLNIQKKLTKHNIRVLVREETKPMSKETTAIYPVLEEETTLRTTISQYPLFILNLLLHRQFVLIQLL